MVLEKPSFSKSKLKKTNHPKEGLMANYIAPFDQAVNCLEAYFAGIVERNHADYLVLEELPSIDYQENQIDGICKQAIKNLTDKYIIERRLIVKHIRTSILLLNAYQLDKGSSLSILPRELIEIILAPLSPPPSNHLSQLWSFTSSNWIRDRLQMGLKCITCARLTSRYPLEVMQLDSDRVNKGLLEKGQAYWDSFRS
jgi:hypothetical protein